MIQRLATTFILLAALIPFAAGAGEVPQDPGDVCPILPGQDLPKLVLKSADGEAFDVNAAVAEKPSIFVIYRGGWCMYCNAHLAKIRTIEKNLLDLGYQILAISSDRPAKLAEDIEKSDLTCTLLSDNDMAGSRALGLAFQVPDDLVAKYKTEYGIDLEGDSGHTHHQLPVPTVLIVGTDGIIDFIYANPDYKVRLAPEVLLAAAKAALAE